MKLACTTRALRVAKALLAAATLLAAVLLIAQCTDLYRLGTSAQNLTETGVRIEDIYSRELVSQRLGRISWSFVIWAAALVLTLILAALAPKEKARIDISVESRLEQALSRAARTPQTDAEERKRRVAAIACAAVCAACAALVAAYLLDASHFASRDLEAVMGAMLLWVSPWVAVAFAALALFEYLGGKSRLRELKAAKDAPRRTPEPPKAQRRAALVVGRVALAIAALALIVAGVLNGGMYDVLVKAVNICTECIGLG